MSSNQWIHCNICYYLFAKKDRRFYLMTCQHTLCKDCMAHTNRGTCCPVCKRKGLQFFEICNGMDKQAKTLFDPGTTKTLEQIYKAINFQTKQKQHLSDHILFVEEKLLKAEQMEQKLKQKIVESQQRYQKTRNYRRSKQEALRQQMTVATLDVTPPAQNSGCSNRPSSSKRHQLNFFEGHTSSSGSNRSHLSTDSKTTRGSFLHLKASSSSGNSSTRSVDFGTTPSSGNRSTGVVNDTFHKMRIDNED
ncbi:RING finger protein narya-like [Ochlerotatus camptorhynchus]|uniref:RING finger protein narya-like n=1 Tax=Ochlerotatus camptorhynchus TaxID=644619 RepID=UPI0031D0597F